MLAQTAGVGPQELILMFIVSAVMLAAVLGVVYLVVRLATRTRSLPVEEERA